MSQQNTALIDDIMAALDAESSQNVELIVRNTQNGATKKMALASLEQIIYSYLTTAPVVSNLASVLGVLQKSIYQTKGAIENVKITFASKEIGDYADVYVFKYGTFSGNYGNMHKILVDITGNLSIADVISNGTTMTKDHDSVSVQLSEYSMLVVYSNMDVTIQKL